MNLQHVNAKLFVSGELDIDMDKLIETFHSWVAGQTMDEMLIDVADYRHVPDGPGVILIGHEADYAIDFKRARPGLLYNRKAPLDGSNQERFEQAFAAASRACVTLEKEFDSLRFDRGRLGLFVNDRALAPNTRETLDGCRADLESFARDFLQQADFELQSDQDPRQRFGVEFQFAQDISFGN